MKLWAVLSACVWLAWTVAGARPETEVWTLVISGSTAGYLAPCGCTKPMSGGIRRRMTVIRQWTRPGSTLVLETGPISGKTGRQAEIKAETLAAAMKLVGTDVVQTTEADQALGLGVIEAVRRLSGAEILGEELARKGPFLVGSASADQSSRVRRLLGDAEAEGRVGILMLDGSVVQARRLAREFPALRLIIYRSESQPARSPERIGSAWLASPGHEGKFVLRLSWNGAAFETYETRELGPDVKDDPRTAAVYRQYQDRVRSDRLLEQLPRADAAGYAGSLACLPCHENAAKVWRKSKHSGALKTLEKDRHDRDPDCTGCHVVGLEAADGFRDRKTTPHLTDVGCESCHGPAKAHALKPKEVRVPPAGAKSCGTCHVPDHSPGFDFAKAWPKIKH